MISIHALLAESDGGVRRGRPSTGHFYPRSPCGERPKAILVKVVLLPHFYPRSPCGERLNQSRTSGLKFLFLSTLSLRRATMDALTTFRG